MHAHTHVHTDIHSYMKSHIKCSYKCKRYSPSPIFSFTFAKLWIWQNLLSSHWTCFCQLFFPPNQGYNNTRQPIFWPRPTLFLISNFALASLPAFPLTFLFYPLLRKWVYEAPSECPLWVLLWHSTPARYRRGCIVSGAILGIFSRHR